MIELTVPGRGEWRIANVVFDVNGTLATDGKLLEGVVQRLAQLQASVAVHLLTADTHGRQATIDAELGLKAERIMPGDESAQKVRFVEKLGSNATVAVGNGANDAGMLQAAAIGIAVLGEEGLCVEALNAADVLVRDIHAALDLLLKSRRLVATLRK